MFEAIYDFCRVRNTGSIFSNSANEPTPRVNFLMELLNSLQIDFELDSFPVYKTKGYNLILRGSSDKMVVAHHDVNNPNIDNANDNSCSVINAIAVKLRRPDVNVVLLDGEEFGGLGAQRVSDQIKKGEFGAISWVLNLELTGKGGRKFFIGKYPGQLSDKIVELFNCPIVTTPFNDSVIFRRNGIDSVVINPLPALPSGKKSEIKFEGEYLDSSLLFRCHKPSDSVDKIDPVDMQEFVEEVVLKILS
jgi:hypothetical protein